MSDVAALAGVSIATVSRVLNGSKPVGEPTATLVRDAARQLSFRPSRSAQLLARRRSRLIGLVISDLLNETLLTWARAAAEHAETLGYQTLLCDGRNSPDAEARQLEQLLEARVDAICLVGPVTMSRAMRDDILAAGIALTPAFMHDRRTARRARSVAERPAINDAVDLLIDGGCRWIATVNIPLDPIANLVFDERRAAITARARLHGLDIGTDHHLGPDPEGLRGLLRRRRTRGGVFALNHDLPGPVIATILASGRAIPDDVALIAFGDSRAAQTWTPRTTVIARDMDAEAREHVAALIAAQELPDADDRPLPTLAMKPATLIARETTTPHRQA